MTIKCGTKVKRTLHGTVIGGSLGAHMAIPAMMKVQWGDGSITYHTYDDPSVVVEARGEGIPPEAKPEGAPKAEEPKREDNTEDMRHMLATQAYRIMGWTVPGRKLGLKDLSVAMDELGSLVAKLRKAAKDSDPGRLKLDGAPGFFGLFESQVAIADLKRTLDDAHKAVDGMPTGAIDSATASRLKAKDDELRMMTDPEIKAMAERVLTDVGGKYRAMAPDALNSIYEAVKAGYIAERERNAVLERKLAEKKDECGELRGRVVKALAEIKKTLEFDDLRGPAEKALDAAEKTLEGALEGGA